MLLICGMNTTIDLEFVRAQFPALAGEWVFMDNAGGSQTLKQVVDRIGEYLLTSDVQHGASYTISQTATARVREAQRAMAAYVNAADPDEIVMGGSTSLLFRILANTLSQTWQAGDEVIVSQTDHEANVSPWTELERIGIKVHVWPVNPEDFSLSLDTLAELMSPRTQLVAVTHTSNVLGAINPIKEIADLVHAHGAKICVDGVAYAPHRAIDVQALGVDYYAFSYYKVFGPHYAMLYGRKHLLEALPGFNHYFIGNDTLPYKFQPGNTNFELAYGLLGIWDYLTAIAKQATGQSYTPYDHQIIQDAFALIQAHEEQLAERLLSFLHSQASVRIIGPQTAYAHQRVATISFVVEGMLSDQLVEQVDPHHIGIRFGDFYAKKLIEGLDLVGQRGVVRVSLVHYNSLEEVDRLIEILATILPK